MWRRWIGTFVGAIAGVVLVPPLVISLQDSLGYEVDPILGGVIPATIGALCLGAIGFWLSAVGGRDEKG